MTEPSDQPRLHDLDEVPRAHVEVAADSDYAQSPASTSVEARSFTTNPYATGGVMTPQKAVPTAPEVSGRKAWVKRPPSKWFSNRSTSKSKKLSKCAMNLPTKNASLPNCSRLGRCSKRSNNRGVVRSRQLLFSIFTGGTRGTFQSHSRSGQVEDPAT